ncbi:REX4, partial [Cucurbita argyrosperma subsp. argyrosperma]
MTLYSAGDSETRVEAFRWTKIRVFEKACENVGLGRETTLPLRLLAKLSPLAALQRSRTIYSAILRFSIKRRNYHGSFYHHQRMPKCIFVYRHKCSACYKQYKKKEHLIEHMRVSYHSVHQPRCGVCQKHCKSFESLREHLNGPLSKSNCSKIFLEQGCGLCLRVLDDRTSLRGHQDICRLTAPVRQGTSLLPTDLSDCYDEDRSDRGLGAIAMDCVMAGGGSDGTLDICIGICLVDEDEKLIFNTFVQPHIPITNYRHEVTGLTEERVRYAMSLKEVQEKVLKILLNGETIERLRLNGGKARLLVGHDLEHDLDCLRMNYPDHMLR